ncbi:MULTISPECIES: bifunctional riboflavin kinase/FAD synthetase [Rhodomicrobium]|uniref:bifunctional riboflavin kinase/FAD synthetase n=1 Tax=Rhodomicrobium TaxID=1068 RepID=UPI000B4BD73B|nr:MULTISPECIES: bifunctional riboflavin kinase/FAD synthetase [Rhodomicrobium]
MDIIKGWRDVPARLKGASLAIGNFDGVHRGHRAVLDVARRAARTGTPVGAMIFEPHPRKFFQPDKPVFQLTSLERKLELLAHCGIDLAAVLQFDASVACLSAEEFVKDVLVDGLAISHATTGYNFFFGKGRQGNPAVLRALGESFGFGVTIVEAAGNSGEIYSSTRVREMLAEGDVAGAADMLGDWWQVEGVVESGAGRGTGLGFPTANVRLADGQSLRHGIYAVRVGVDGAWHHGAAYLGTRPTFDAGAPLLETFLFDFDGDLYGRSIKIQFIDFVRPDAKFRSGTDLAAQMRTDVAKAEEILRRADAQEKN